MSEVEKMYENANIEKKEKGYCDCDYMNCPYPEIDSCGKECPYWVHKGIDYPPFTAEKQIAIIKFLISKHASFNTRKDLYTVYYECRHYPKEFLSFEEAIAESVNYLWQNLTEDECKQVKGILE